MTAIPTKPLITRKEISQLLAGAVTPRQLAENEKKLGLDKARAKWPGRPLLFRTCVVIMILRKEGLIE